MPYGNIRELWEDKPPQMALGVINAPTFNPRKNAPTKLCKLAGPRFRFPLGKGVGPWEGPVPKGPEKTQGIPPTGVIDGALGEIG